MTKAERITPAPVEGNKRSRGGSAIGRAVARCGDFGGRRADGRPCGFRSKGLCHQHGEDGKRGGRPSLYTEERTTEILDRMASGELLIHICADTHLPSYRTIAGWVFNDSPPGFSQRYARARELQADIWAEQALAIADDATGDVVAGKKGPEVDHENIQRSRLRVDTRKWMASVLKPRAYGSRAHIQHSGKVPKKLRITEIVVRGPSAKVSSRSRQRLGFNEIAYENASRDQVLLEKHWSAEGGRQEN